MNKIHFIEKLELKITILYKLFYKNVQNTDNHECFKNYNRSNQTLIKFATNEEIDTFNETIKFILSHNNFDRLFSEYYISKELIQLCHILLKDNQSIHEYVLEFYNKLIDLSKINWYIVSKMDDIKLADSKKYDIIGCTIKYLELSDIPHENAIYKDYIGQPIIFTNVKAGDSEKARNIALNRFNISYNLLRVYTHNFKRKPKGFLVYGNQNLIIWNESKNSSYTTIKPSLDDLCDSEGNPVVLKSVHLNNELYVQLINDGIPNLSNTNTINDVLYQCLYWFGLGLDSTRESTGLINFTTVLESILKTKDETTELKQRIADRCALLLGDDFQNRMKIQEDLNKIYRFRSKIVHRGKMIDDKDIVNLAGFYAKSVIIKTIQENNRLEGDFNRFINEIDEKKFL